MSEQIKQAVEIAISSQSQQALKQQALQYLQQIKESPDGLTAFTSLLDDPSYHQETRFVALQTISELMPQASQEQLFHVRQVLTKCLSNTEDSVFMRNKLSATIAQLFYHTYQNSWQSFFQDIEVLFDVSNLAKLDYYLRILLAVNQHVGDQIFVQGKEHQEKNNNIKDLMRVSAVAQLSKNWLQILTALPEHDELIKNTLLCIGNYISWIDINLIVYDAYVVQIFKYLSTKSRTTCADTLCEIISKKMKPEDKLQLLSLLNLTTVVTQLSIDDVEFTEHCAKLTGAIGLELCYILDHSASLKQQADMQIINLWPFILRFLGDEYDDTSSQVFEFLGGYLTSLRKSKMLDQEHLTMMGSLLEKIIAKMKYDNDDDGMDDDANQEFDDIRAKLKNFLFQISSIAPELYCKEMTQCIEQLLIQNSWQCMELGLYQLANFAESLRNNTIGVPKSQLQSSGPFHQFVGMFNSILSLDLNHPLCQLLFFEFIVRHYQFYSINGKNDQAVLPILNKFFTPMGLFNQLEKVRLRAWYLFGRFVKSTKPSLPEGDLSMLMGKISPLLVIKASSDEVDTIFGNQLYLFESCGVLIGSNLSLFDAIVNPLFSDLEKCIANKSSAIVTAGTQPTGVILQTHHLLMAIGTLCRGLEVKQNQIAVEKFSNVAEVILVTLQNFNRFELVRDAARFSFARLMPILGSNIANYLSRLISLILTSDDLTIMELIDFLGFVGNVVHTFNKDPIIYQLLNDLLTPLISKIFSILSSDDESSPQPTTNNATRNVIITDAVRDKLELKRAYVNLILNLLQNNVSSLLLTETNKKTLPMITESLSVYAQDLSEINVVKIAISCLNTFVSNFGTGVITDQADAFGSAVKVEGIDQFFITNLIPLVFEIPFKNAEFDVKDANFRYVAEDLSLLLKALLNMSSNNVSTFLSQVYFPQIQFPPNLSGDFVSNLYNLDDKEFKKYFVTFISNLKS